MRHSEDGDGIAKKCDDYSNQIDQAYTSSSKDSHTVACICIKNESN